ncbi:MAG: hypothetical protein KC561_13105, partial [Myxococcales bacterium]|nr:hypothetical protein [Myxococcales bacterium]
APVTRHGFGLWADRGFDVLLWIIIGVSIVLRFRHLSYMEFKYDEYHLLVMAYEHVFGPGIAQTALNSSVGLYNPPGFIYLLSVPVYFTTAPIDVTAFIAGLNVIAILGLYIWVRKTVSHRAGLLVTAVFAVAPWAIIFSRKIWNPDVFLFFHLGCYALLVGLTTKYRAWKVLAFGLWFGLTTQMHLGAWFLPAGVVLYLIIARVKIRWFHALGSLLLFGLTYLPYLLFHINDHFANLRAFLDGRGSGEGGVSVLTNLVWSFRVTTGLETEYLLGERPFARFLEENGLNWAPTLFLIMAVAGAVAVLGTTIWLVVTRWRGRGQEWSSAQLAVLAMLCMFVGVHGACAVLGIRMYPHYHVIFYPLAAFALGGAVWGATRLGWVASWIARLALTTALVLSLLYSWKFQDFVVANPRGLYGGDYGVPYIVQEDMWLDRLSQELGRIYGEAEQ